MLPCNIMQICQKKNQPLTHPNAPPQGYGGNMDMASYLMRQIASHGALVVALEHTDGTASSTRLPNGTLLPFSPSLLSSDEQLFRRATELLQATEANSLPADLQYDKNRVFLGGHSYGLVSIYPSISLSLPSIYPNTPNSPLPRGPSALKASAIRGAMKNPPETLPNIAGLILHDPAIGMGRGIAPTSNSPPIVSYTSDEYDRAGIRCGRTVISINLSINLSVYPAIYLLIYLLIYLPAYLPILSDYLSIYLPAYLPTFSISRSIQLSIYLPIYQHFLSVDLSSYLSIYPSIYLIIYLPDLTCLPNLSVTNIYMYYINTCLSFRPSFSLPSTYPNTPMYTYIDPRSTAADTTTVTS
jgi:hypothetical protein